jgi:hypothetical protein
MKATIIAICLIASVACHSIAADSNAVRARSERSGVCTLHHVRLVHATGYDVIVPPRTIIDLGNDQAALWEKYPNAMYPIYQRHRSADHPRPVSVTYCPVCQKLYERDWAKHH